MRSFDDDNENTRLRNMRDFANAWPLTDYEKAREFWLKSYNLLVYGYGPVFYSFSCMSCLAKGKDKIIHCVWSPAKAIQHATRHKRLAHKRHTRRDLK